MSSHIAPNEETPLISPHFGPTARPKRVEISGRNSLDLQEGSVAAPGSLQQPGSVRPGPETDKPGSVQAASEAAVTSPVPADKGGTDDHGAVPQQPSSTVKGGPAAKLSSRQRRPSRPDLAPDAPSNGEDGADRSASDTEKEAPTTVPFRSSRARRRRRARQRSRARSSDGQADRT